jgi:hypothetical protein
MTAWPRYSKPESDEEDVFAQFSASDVPLMVAAALADRELGHEPRPVLVELKEADGSLRYEAMDGPRCHHLCAKCREDVEQGMQEFGTGAIGIYADSSGGEMEKLRRALAALAQTIQARLPPPKESEALAEGAPSKRLGDGT